MDLGLFKRRRSVFWMLIILPPLLTGLIYFGMDSYCRRVEATVRQERSLAQYLPALETALTLAKDETAKFNVISGTAAEAQAALNTRISDISARCGLTVNSLTITSESSDAPIQKLDARMEGDGHLLHIMKFINSLQSPKSLISLRSAKLTMREMRPVPTYHWTFEFRTGFVPTVEGAAL